MEECTKLPEPITELKDIRLDLISTETHHFIAFKKTYDFFIVLVNTKQYEEALNNPDLTFDSDKNWNIANLIALVKFKQPVEGNSITEVISKLEKEIYNIGLNVLVNGNRQ